MALGVLVGGCTSTETSAAAPPPSTGAEPLRVGVALPTYHYDVTAVTTWERETGHRADVVQTFVPWLYSASPNLTAFPVSRAQQISEAGRVLEVTWTPAEPSGGDDNPGIDLGDIADGRYDSYVRRFARDVRDSGLTIRLRFAHEMNGTWSRWSETTAENAPGDYVRAWRHLHDLFAEEGATSVTWVWSPNIVGTKTEPLSRLYPGDAYVDEVGVDGYSYPRTGCPSPSSLFEATLAQVRRVSTRPVALAEVGVSTACPGRAAWVTDLYTWARSADLVGVTWWERSGDDGDYRIAGSSTTRAALRRALASTS